jgi:hypothetical protein
MMSLSKTKLMHFNFFNRLVKDLTQAGGYKPIVFESSQRGTYCVWELGPVWHERHAWVRFLSSKRDEEAKLAYVNDRFSGLV